MNVEKIYCSINEIARITGLSRIYVRRGCREGKFPIIRVGEGKNATYLIHREKFLSQLEAMTERERGDE